MKNNGPARALLAAILFGVSPPIAKRIMGDMSPILLAGLLYLGSGLGLALFLIRPGQGSFRELAKLSTSHRGKLFGSVVSGGIIAPLLLAYGIRAASAFEVSVLLNLETVATTVIASVIFHEHIGKFVWPGKILILMGGLLISVGPTNGTVFSIPGLLIVGACLFWGLDNNLTREVEELSPVILAILKGLTAGLFNIALAFVIGVSPVHPGPIGGILLLGAFSYGLSLVFFIQSLRAIGASRTGSYFASGPFFGMLFAVLLLGERPNFFQWLAAMTMAAGIWVLSRENHSHLHTHETITHRHRHTHDEHHQHPHDGTEGSEPHDHSHTHEPLVHTHPHLPDIHHRHPH